jgi:uncharacterized surface protein with fasciclin (FAS1) repeats
MQTVTFIAKTIMAGVRRDMRVRWGLGAGASVLLSASVLGMGGSIVPEFLQASTTPQAVVQTSEIVETPPTPIIFPTQKDEGFVVDMSTSTVADIIHTMSKAERFDLMVYNSDLTDALNHAGTITAFVPASADFDYLPRGYISGLSRQETRSLVLGHIVERALPMQESLNGNVITAGGTMVSFNVDASSNSVTVGDAKVLKVYKAKNGYVYLIDKVLVQK